MGIHSTVICTYIYIYIYIHVYTLAILSEAIDATRAKGVSTTGAKHVSAASTVSRVHTVSAPLDFFFKKGFCVHMPQWSQAPEVPNT